MYKLIQYREGFATNSSSTHSLVYLPYNTKEDHDNAEVNEGDYDDPAYLCIEGKKGKALYTYYDLMHGKEFSKQELLDILELKEEDISDNTYGTTVAPLGNIENAEDLKEFKKKYIDNPSVGIEGYNDNYGYDARIDHKEFPKYNPDNIWIENDKLLIIFNRDTGLKMHFSKDPSIQDIDALPGIFPELVDLKITNYCTAGCKFCYQNSQSNGEHADLEYVRSIIQELGKLNTFEIAIGGGEPLQYSYLKEVLLEALENGIIPNFTTKNYDLLLENIELVKHTGGVAMSITNMEDTKKAISIIMDEKNKDYRGKLSLQIPVGIMTFSELDDMINYISDLLNKEAELIRSKGSYPHNDIRITLLGFKKVGRGNNFTYNDYLDKLSTAFGKIRSYYDRVNECEALTLERKCSSIYIGIDTQLANSNNDLAIAAKSISIMHSEGVRSCYIDAVGKTISPSSYCDVSKYIPIDNINNLGEMFCKISKIASLEYMNIRNQIQENQSALRELVWKKARDEYAQIR